MSTARVLPRRRLAATGAVCALLTMTGCSGSGPSGGSGATPTSSVSVSAPAPHSTAASTRLTIKNFAFIPAAVKVAPGAVVTVTNQDQTAHTVTATGKKVFDTGDIAPGRTVTFTVPKTAGAYRYICAIHPFMKGVVDVT